jgi:hypothetical protein
LIDSHVDFWFSLTFVAYPKGMSLERRLGSFKYFLTLVALTLLSSVAYVALGKHTKKHF